MEQVTDLDIKNLVIAYFNKSTEEKTDADLNEFDQEMTD